MTRGEPIPQRVERRLGNERREAGFRKVRRQDPDSKSRSASRSIRVNRTSTTGWGR
jgi:hypothetical protein